MAKKIPNHKVVDPRISLVLGTHVCKKCKAPVYYNKKKYIWQHVGKKRDTGLIHDLSQPEKNRLHKLRVNLRKDVEGIKTDLNDFTESAKQHNVSWIVEKQVLSKEESDKTRQEMEKDPQVHKHIIQIEQSSPGSLSDKLDQVLSALKDLKSQLDSLQKRI